MDTGKSQAVAEVSPAMNVLAFMFSTVVGISILVAWRMLLGADTLSSLLRPFLG